MQKGDALDYGLQVLHRICLRWLLRRECIGALREPTVWMKYWQSIDKLVLDLYPCVLGRFAEEPTDRETLQRSH